MTPKNRYIVLCGGRHSAADEYDRLLKHPDLIKIEMPKRSVYGAPDFIFYTKTIYITQDRRRYAIGRFKITLGSRIGFINLSRTRRYMYSEFYHPHIRLSGPCLGNVQNQLWKMILDRRFAAVFAICVQYLKSYNPDDSEAPPLALWPRVKPRAGRGIGFKVKRGSKYRRAT